MKFDIKSIVRVMLTGFLMGSADLVPGVSGGTIAFISGIYERLITSIKVVTSEVPILVLKGKIAEAFKAVPWMFLGPLAVGMGTAIVLLSSTLEHLLLTQEALTLSFFFGLVLASIYLVSRKLKAWTATSVIAAVITAVLGYSVAIMGPAQTAATPLAFFLSGALAICAMILPGISGSFILLIIGKYAQILSALNDRDFVTLGIFGLGIVVGIAVFSRVLSWLFKHYHDVTIASLTGIMVGSLAKIWPWKETISTRINSHGVEEPLQQANIAPDEMWMVAIVLMLLGAGLILMLDRVRGEE